MLASFPEEKFIVTPSTWYVCAPLHNLLLYISLFLNLSLSLSLSLSLFVPEDRLSFILAGILTCSYRWMGEKYDGIRSCWHSQLRIGYPDPVLIPHFTYSSLSKFKLIITIYTRSGRALPLLPELDGCLPRIIADGEFW